MAFIYARSDDVGAPTLTGEPGKMVALLKACLVDGFGAKSAAGWTVPYEDAANNVAVFRPDGGHRFFYRVDDNASTSRGARVATLEGFKSMIGHAVTDGTADFCGGLYKLVLSKSKDLNANATPWVLFADDKKCWFFAGSAYYKNSTQSSLTDGNFDSMYTFFGDYYSVGTDSNSAAIFSSPDTKNTTPISTGFFKVALTDAHNCPGDINGTVASTKLAGFSQSLIATYTVGVSWGSGGKGGFSLNHPLTNDIHICRLMIADTEGSSTMKTLSKNTRGFLPGLILAVNYMPAQFEDYTIAGKNYINIGLDATWSNNKAPFLMSTDGLDF